MTEISIVSNIFMNNHTEVFELMLLLGVYGAVALDIAIASVIVLFDMGGP